MGKERTAGEETIELHLYYVTGRASRRSRRTSLAVVAYRDGQLYCICTVSQDGPAAGAAGHRWPSLPVGTVSCTAFVPSGGEGAEGRRGRRKEEQEKEGRGKDRGKSYKHQADGGEIC